MDRSISSDAAEIELLRAILDVADSGLGAPEDEREAGTLRPLLELLFDCESAVTWTGDSVHLREPVQVTPARSASTEWHIEGQIDGVVRAALELRRDVARPFGERDFLLLDLLRPHLIRWLTNRGPLATPGRSAVTDRQLEILALARVGMGNREIARHLDIREATVRKHLEGAFARLGVASRTAAVAAVFGSASELIEHE